MLPPWVISLCSTGGAHPHFDYCFHKVIIKKNLNKLWLSYDCTLIKTSLECSRCSFFFYKKNFTLISHCGPLRGEKVAFCHCNISLPVPVWQIALKNDTQLLRRRWNTHGVADWCHESFHLSEMECLSCACHLIPFYLQWWHIRRLHPSAK